MFANADMSSSTSAKNRPGKKSGKSIKKKPGKPGSRSRSQSAPPPKGGYERYSGLETIRPRPEADRKLPIGSHGKIPSDFRKYGSQNSNSFQLDSDLSWPDARKAAGVLMNAVPPLTSDLNAKQKSGYEHLITDLLFHAPKLGHEILAGGEGPYAGLNLQKRTYFNTAYGAQMAVSGHAMRITNGDLLRSLQLAKTDFNKWAFEMKDIIPAEERKFPHYLTTGRLQQEMEKQSKFKYVPENFFKEFRFAQVISGSDDEDSDEDKNIKNDVGESTSQSVTVQDGNNQKMMMELLTQINTSQQNLSKRIQKVESRVGVMVSPLKPELDPTPKDKNILQPRKIDLLSPETVKIETSTGGTAFKLMQLICFMFSFSEPKRKSGFSVVPGSPDVNEAAIYTPRMWAQTHTKPNLRYD